MNLMEHLWISQSGHLKQVTIMDGGIVNWNTIPTELRTALFKMAF
jgi:hypothetical protein